MVSLFFLNSFKGYTYDLSQTQIRELIESALKVWSDVTPLKFREISRSATADIEISFPRRDHGDGYPLDGQGGTLAHAFFPGPGIGGDAHFDDDELFLYNTDVNGKTILQQVDRNILFFQSPRGGGFFKKKLYGGAQSRV